MVKGHETESPTEIRHSCGTIGTALLGRTTPCTQGHALSSLRRKRTLELPNVIEWIYQSVFV